MFLPIDEVDYFVEVDVDDPKYQWMYIAEKDIKPNAEVQAAIAQNCVSIMRDGDCIQVGIGALPTAVVIGMRDHGLKHLGVHSEMIGEYAFTLAEAGVVDNSRKSIDTGTMRLGLHHARRHAPLLRVGAPQPLLLPDATSATRTIS